MKAFLSASAAAAFLLTSLPVAHAGGMMVPLCTGDGTVRMVRLPLNDDSAPSPDRQSQGKACHVACCPRKDDGDDDGE